MITHNYILPIFNSNLKKVQSQLRAGFSMLEVVCALMLVGILSFFLLEWHTTVVYALRAFTQRVHALTLACSIIDQYRAVGTWGKQVLELEQELRHELPDMTITKEYRPDTLVQEFGWITVTVTWKDRGIMRSINLQTGVQNKG